MAGSKPTLNRGGRRYKQGQFIPKHPEKYIGNPLNIVYRSGWEKMFLKWCDITGYVLKYGSEELVVPYVSPIDGNTHRYFVDFVVYILHDNGKVKKYAIEIKPFAQTQQPKMAKSHLINEAYIKKVQTFAVNQAKWKAAKEYCSRFDMEFIILTEKELLKKK